MKNILDEKPTDELHGRLRFSASFIEDSDVSGKCICDIGCGFGWLELNLLKRKCGYVTGVEVTEKDLKTAKRHITDERVSFKVGSAVSLPFEDRCFDTVTSFEVLEHVSEGAEDRMFHEVNRVLKNNGVFYMSTPHSSFFAKTLDTAWWLIGHRHYLEDDIKRLADISGFRVERMLLRGGLGKYLG